MIGTYRRKGKYFHKFYSIVFECFVVSRNQRIALFGSLKVNIACCKDSNLKNIILIYIYKKNYDLRPCRQKGKHVHNPVEQL